MKCLNSYLMFQEIIKVRGNPHIGPLTKVIPYNLFLDIVPMQFLRGYHSRVACFFVEDLLMLFRFVSKQRKTSNAVEMSSLIFFCSRYVFIHLETLIEV